MSGKRVPWDWGMTVATELISALARYCVRLTVAGSLRRGRERVRDIELVAMPAFNGEINLLDGWCNKWQEDQVFRKRLKSNGALLAWGSRFKAFTYQGMAVDLFIVLPDREWGPTYLLRTGPNLANQALVTREGMTSPDGAQGICPSDIRWEKGALVQDGYQVTTPEEVDVFRAYSLPWIAPPLRDARYYRTAQSVSRQARRRGDDELPAHIPNWPVTSSGVYTPAGEWIDEPKPQLAPMEMARPATVDQPRLL